MICEFFKLIPIKVSSIALFYSFIAYPNFKGDFPQVVGVENLSVILRLMKSFLFATSEDPNFLSVRA
jgi:hypothetical protein